MYRALALTLSVLLSACATLEDTNSGSGGADTSGEPSEVDRVDCDLRAVAEVDGTTIWRVVGDDVLLFTAGMSIDADGAPNAYHPPTADHPSGSPPGLDHLGNAGRPGNWWALVTDDSTSSGNPIVQDRDRPDAHPKPGFYISTTALVDSVNFPWDDTRRYVDATRIPYMVMPGRNANGAKKGDFAIVYRASNEQRSGAIYADIGPRDHIGEGSIALAERLGIPSDPRRGGTSGGISYLVFLGSGNGRPRPVDEIDSVSAELFDRWGGVQRLKFCLERR